MKANSSKNVFKRLIEKFYYWGKLAFMYQLHIAI